jgi:hypothetical protein
LAANFISRNASEKRSRKSHPGTELYQTFRDKKDGYIKVVLKP